MKAKTKQKKPRIWYGRLNVFYMNVLKVLHDVVMVNNYCGLRETECHLQENLEAIKTLMEAK